jgi:hypothetical protein
MTLHALQRKTKAFDISREVTEVILDTKEDIAELNRGQMFLGKRADGTDITPTYADLTIAIKESLGEPSDRVTLRDTGAFWDSIEVDANSETFTIDATDEKTNKLVKKYGNKIFGLSKESKSEEYIPLYFFPALKNRIEQKLGLKMS